MAVRILKDEEQGYSCLYCSTTMWAFGGIFYQEENAEDFLNWMGDTDPRSLKDKELENKIHEWRELSKKQDRKLKNKQTSFREAKTAFDVLNSLGGKITGDYLKDLNRANKLNVFFSEKLYSEAYQINEQP